MFAATSLSAIEAKVELMKSDQNDQKSSKANEIQLKSSYPLGTAPLPFQDINNPHNNAAVSTGYYLVDSDEDVPAFWKPSEAIVDTNDEPERWRRILPGPRLVSKTFWENNTEEGLRFFRNPAYPIENGRDFFEHNTYPQDTTDNAFAGPMPLNLIGGFIFNGIRYDSFYVTTNGLVALTNRRYFYDEFGNRYIPSGEDNAYDPNSMDYFVNSIGGESRARSGNGLNDPAPDYFGYKYSIIGGNESDPNGGIRGDFNVNGQNLTTPTGMNQITSAAYKPALIGFMYGDYELSQFGATEKKVDNFGKVYYKRSLLNDKLIIYFMNLTAVKVKIYPPFTITYPNNMRPGDEGYTGCSGQVILNRNDSSITIVYERFMGGVRSGNISIPARDIFRGNSTVGVYGFARHANYNRTGGPDENDTEFPWVSEYAQYTHYFSYIRAARGYPNNFSSVKFKQHQNTLRVVDIQYRVRKQDPNADLAYSEQVKTKEVNDYELLAGNDYLGSIQPVAIIQNLSNDIQSPTGTNFVPQDLNFSARFRVINQATGRIIYNRGVPVDNKCLSTPDDNLQACNNDPDVRVRLVNVTVDEDQNFEAEVADYPGTNPYNGKTRTGIPPYGYVQVKFPPFEPNEFARDENNKLYQIGRMAAFVIAEPKNPSTGKEYGDKWPFDDTAAVNLHVMKLHTFFSDDATEYHLINGTAIPSVQKWVSVGPEVASGDFLSRHPLAPRGQFAADNNENYTLQSPVIKMNRINTNNVDFAPYGAPANGDQLRSHPIDMRGRFGSVISVSIQRTLDKKFWNRGYGDNQLIGPEPRAVLNQDIFTVFNTTPSVAQNPDMLALEVMLPSDNGVKFITNVPDKRWREHPRRHDLDPVTDVPALGVFGAGGYLTGFLETDPDSSLALPNTNTRERNSLRADIYDDGFDFVYKKYFVPIPDTFIRWKNAGAKHFRFRLRVIATTDQKTPLSTPDDDDNFLVDNIRVLFRTGETTDIEVSAIQISWPYTESPATQGTKVPVEVSVSNNTINNAPFYYVLVKIFKGTNTFGEPVYCRTEAITVHEGNREKVRSFPDFNARDFGPGTYRAQAIVVVPGGDLEPLNDTTYTDFTLKFGPTFAYDPVDNPTNDIGSDPAFPPGRGLNIQAYNYGGRGNVNNQSGGYNELTFGAGYVGGSTSGQIAMKFELLQTDTIYGYDAYFGLINQAPDAIALAIYKGVKDNDKPQGEPLKESILNNKSRGRDDRTDNLVFGEYVRYLMPKDKPLILTPGVYWMAISQLGETGLELGGSIQRAGLRTMSVYIPPPVGLVSDVGGSGISLNIHKEFRKRTANNSLVNNNYFAFENTRGSGQWQEFTPSVGNIGYAHLHHFGWVPAEGTTLTLTNGTWIPLIRPFLRDKASGNSTETIDDCGIPIELTEFKHDERKDAIDLFWTTASEENNKGFYIEKSTEINNEFTEWSQISFINGNGNTKTPSYYNFSDKDVKTGTTYRYRLRQVDFDGTQSCFDSEMIEVEFIGDGGFALKNYPNPAKESTTFEYSLDKDSFVKLEVLDLLGNVIKTLVNSDKTQGLKTLNYDMTDAIGNKLASGSYIYRLTVDGKTETSKLNVVK